MVLFILRVLFVMLMAAAGYYYLKEGGGEFSMALALTVGVLIA